MKIKSSKDRGFALVVTLSLMILLTVIAVGLLTLSSISLRATNQSDALLSARANARMALMLAIGDLQLQAGPDTRVTARADILKETNPPILGVWKSWEGTDHTTTGPYAGRPVSPGNYKTTKEGRFLRWLVSGDPTNLTSSDSPPTTAQSATSVALVGTGSVDASVPNSQVHLTPVPVVEGTKKGAYAWWVGGENQKAHLPTPPEVQPSTAAEWAGLVKSSSSSDPLPFGLEKILGNPEIAAKVSDLKQVDLIDPSAEGTLKPSVKHFHDLSAVSTGLLTNTATGGWRKDLSLFTENYSSLPTSGLPMFRLTPTTDNSCSIPGGVASKFRAPKSILFPWCDYRGNGSERAIYQHGAVASWENLKDYAMLYQSTGSFSIASRSVRNDSGSPADCFAFMHKVRLLPVIARVQWVLSHSAGPAPTTVPPSPAGSLNPRLLVTPVITLWNPYNVTLNCSGGFKFRIPKPLPCVLKYTVDGVAYTKFRSLTTGSLNYTSVPFSATTSVLAYTITSGFSLGAGQTRVYSPKSNTPVAASNAEMVIEPGYRKGGGHFFSVLADNDKPAIGNASSRVKVSAKFDNVYADGADGVGIYLDMQSIADGNAPMLVYRMVFDPVMARQTYPELTTLAESTSLGSTQNVPVPFLSTMFGARLASNTHIPAKGFLQTSPFVNFTAMGGKALRESTIQRAYGGTNHPVNSPFDYSFVAHTGLDSYLPNVTGESGYIVSGFTSGNGLSRCIAAEVPTRPLASLAELQNWDMRYENPIPPYAFNIIGNSDATPLLPSDGVVNKVDSNFSNNLQHDDSYCANHLLFDDWFFSSIAAGSATGFGKASPLSLKKPYIDFLTGAMPLINRAYKPLPEHATFAKESTANANTLYNKQVQDPSAWKNIASRIEVEGMFNVNSTSVTAWRALLGHARNHKIPFTNSSGGVDLSESGDYYVSRSSIAGDRKAGTPGISGGFSASSEFTGYRELDGKQLDAFAEKIVAQIRQRGPFLSLSEFVNRQLSTGDLALAGTIQAALNDMQANSSTNIYSGVISALDAPPDKKFATGTPPGGTSGYQFPKAAEGICIFGIPGWTRQADILRPLAPILSARDDTFVVRAYGDSRDITNKVLARATCEVIVRRSHEYCDPTEKGDLTTPPTRPLNRTFGRRFEVVSFRWLSPSEI